MSLERFARRMEIRARNVPREVGKIVRRVALAADQAVVLGTPVDIGRARSNWIVSLGSEVTEPIEPYSPIAPGTDPGKISETGNAQAALAQGREQIAQRKSEQAIHITNNVPYIKPLNEGSSSQAPAMFVEAAVQQGIDAVAGARINTG